MFNVQPRDKAPGDLCRETLQKSGVLEKSLVFLSSSYGVWELQGPLEKRAVYVDGNGGLRGGDKQGEINASHRDSNCNASAEHLLDGVWRF